jgi:hypothetical protein
MHGPPRDWNYILRSENLQTKHSATYDCWDKGRYSGTIWSTLKLEYLWCYGPTNTIFIMKQTLRAIFVANVVARLSLDWQPSGVEQSRVFAAVSCGWQCKMTWSQGCQDWPDDMSYDARSTKMGRTQSWGKQFNTILWNLWNRTVYCPCQVIFWQAGI